MLAPGNRALVNMPMMYGNFTQQPLIDQSGNTTNMVQWLSTSSEGGHKSSRRTVFSR